MLTNHIVSPFS